MKRIIQMGEQELDVLINRAFLAGVLAQHRHQFVVGKHFPHGPRFQEARDASKAELKRTHFERD